MYSTITRLLYGFQVYEFITFHLWLSTQVKVDVLHRKSVDKWFIVHGSVTTKIEHLSELIEHLSKFEHYKRYPKSAHGILRRNCDINQVARHCHGMILYIDIWLCAFLFEDIQHVNPCGVGTGIFWDNSITWLLMPEPLVTLYLQDISNHGIDFV